MIRVHSKACGTSRQPVPRLGAAVQPITDSISSTAPLATTALVGTMMLGYDRCSTVDGRRQTVTGAVAHLKLCRYSAKEILGMQAARGAISSV